MDNFIKMFGQKTGLSLFLIAMGTSSIFPSAAAERDRGDKENAVFVARAVIIYKMFASAIAAKDITKVIELIERGYSPHVCLNGESLIYCAVYHNNLQALTLFLAAGVGVEVPPEVREVRTPLQLAAVEGYKDCVQILLACNAEVDVLDMYGGTPLLRAAAAGHYEVVELLLNHGASVNICSQGGRSCTPLMAAAQYGRLDIVRLLVARGAGVNVGNFYGDLPLHMAVIEGHVAVAQALLLLGAHVNLGNNAGETPLFLALYESMNPTIAMVKLLLDSGAEITAAIQEKINDIPNFHIKKMIKNRLKNSSVKCPLPVRDVLEDNTWISDTEKKPASKGCNARRKNKGGGGAAAVAAACESTAASLPAATAAVAGGGAPPLPDTQELVTPAAALTAGAGAPPSPEYVSSAAAAAAASESSSCDEFAAGVEEDVSAAAGAGTLRTALPTVFLNFGEEGYVNFTFSPARRFSVGGKIIFKNHSLLRANVLSILEEEEAAAAAVDTFYKRDRRAVVSLAPRVAGCSAAELRANVGAALCEESMDHVVSESLILNALRYGSSYLSRERATTKPPCLLVVAPVERVGVGAWGEAALKEKNFLTLCFEVNEGGTIGRCFHFCAQKKHPREINDGGEYKYALQPLHLKVKLRQERMRHKLKLKAASVDHFKDAYQHLLKR